MTQTSRPHIVVHQTVDLTDLMNEPPTLLVPNRRYQTPGRSSGMHLCPFQCLHISFTGPVPLLHPENLLITLGFANRTTSQKHISTALIPHARSDSFLHLLTKRFLSLWYLKFPYQHTERGMPLAEETCKPVTSVKDNQQPVTEAVQAP